MSDSLCSLSLLIFSYLLMLTHTFKKLSELKCLKMLFHQSPYKIMETLQGDDILRSQQRFCPNICLNIFMGFTYAHFHICTL